MGTLAYHGAPVSNDPDLAYLDYVTGKKSADLTSDAVDALINAGLAPYATLAYVDAQDAKNATRAYIDAQDAQRLALASKGLANGIVPLDATGRIPPGLINAPLTQRYGRGPWSPNAYNSGTVLASTETTLYSCPVTDPGYPYRLVVFGAVDAQTDRDSEYPIVNVRVADPAAGEIIASGQGAADASVTAAPGLGDQFSGTDFSTGWNVTNVDGTAGQYDQSGGAAVWTSSGTDARTVRYRRTDSGDALSLTDFQKVRTAIVTVGDNNPTFGGSGWYLRMCGRMNSSEDHWVGVNFDINSCQLEYSIGGGVVQMQNGVNGFTVTPSNAPSFSGPAGTVVDLICGTVNNSRQYLVQRNGTTILTATDTAGVTGAGPSFRGWGFFGHAGAAGIFGSSQTSPPSLDYMLVGDAPPNSNQVSIVPTPLVSATVRTGATTLYVRAKRSGSSATIQVSAFMPQLSVFAYPAG